MGVQKARERLGTARPRFIWEIPGLGDILVTGVTAADAVFRGVGLKRNVRPLEPAQQFVLAPAQAFAAAVEGGVAGLSLKNAIESGAQLGGALGLGASF
jgi:hypothetical protein